MLLGDRAVRICNVVFVAVVALEFLVNEQEKWVFTVTCVLPVSWLTHTHTDTPHTVTHTSTSKQHAYDMLFRSNNGENTHSTPEIVCSKFVA